MESIVIPHVGDWLGRRASTGLAICQCHIPNCSVKRNRSQTSGFHPVTPMGASRRVKAFRSPKRPGPTPKGKQPTRDTGELSGSALPAFTRPRGTFSLGTCSITRTRAATRGSPCSVGGRGTHWQGGAGKSETTLHLATSAGVCARKVAIEFEGLQAAVVPRTVGLQTRRECKTAETEPEPALGDSCSAGVRARDFAFDPH